METAEIGPVVLVDHFDALQVRSYVEERGTAVIVREPLPPGVREQVSGIQSTLRRDLCSVFVYPSRTEEGIILRPAPRYEQPRLASISGPLGGLVRRDFERMARVRGGFDPTVGMRFHDELRLYENWHQDDFAAQATSSHTHIIGAGIFYVHPPKDKKVEMRVVKSTPLARYFSHNDVMTLCRSGDVRVGQLEEGWSVYFPRPFLHASSVVLKKAEEDLKLPKLRNVIA